MNVVRDIFLLLLALQLLELRCQLRLSVSLVACISLDRTRPARTDASVTTTRFRLFILTRTQVCCSGAMKCKHVYSNFRFSMRKRMATVVSSSRSELTKESHRSMRAHYAEYGAYPECWNGSFDPQCLTPDPPWVQIVRHVRRGSACHVPSAWRSPHRFFRLVRDARPTNTHTHTQAPLHHRCGCCCCCC
jgi:hypothetical protein